jgi:hypothetical protein
MRRARLITFVSVATALSFASAHAQEHGGGHAAVTATHGSPHTTTTPSKTTTSGATSSNPTPSSTSTVGATRGGTTTTVSPIAARIASHPQLAAKCTSLLPKGMTLNQAARGFRNQGQFIAALHVSKNLGIPFADLKNAMTGPSPKSLGQAIHTLRPHADADDEVERATAQASTELKTTTGSTTATTSTTATHK